MLFQSTEDVLCIFEISDDREYNGHSYFKREKKEHNFFLFLYIKSLAGRLSFLPFLFFVIEKWADPV